MLRRVLDKISGYVKFDVQSRWSRSSDECSCLAHHLPRISPLTQNTRWSPPRAPTVRLLSQQVTDVQITPPRVVHHPRVPQVHYPGSRSAPGPHWSVRGPRRPVRGPRPSVRGQHCHYTRSVCLTRSRPRSLAPSLAPQAPLAPQTTLTHWRTVLVSAASAARAAAACAALLSPAAGAPPRRHAAGPASSRQVTTR